ncbi:MAG: phospholipase D-like domain-containing protein [Actinomycetota bacterium]|nr:phospholipase D-like domain-containing protein [Actinomycetota bacterium]
MASPHVRRIAGGVGLGLATAGGLAYQVARYKRKTRQRFEMPGGPVPGSAEFSRLVSAMTGAPLRIGNRVKIMRNGATLDAMVAAICSAQETIDCSSYIYWPGATADRFSSAFIERARAGVEVNLVLDGYGSAKLAESHLERLRHGGVNVSVFRPPRWYNVAKLNNRMHRRILVVDGALAFAGGVGIADVWTGDAQDPLHWRETHLRIQGPAVADLFGAFLENWTEATGGLLAGTHIAETDSFDDGVALQVTRSTPTGGATAATELFYCAIAGARERLWLTTAYFAPDRTFEDVLCAAARGGVDVRVLVNGQHADKEVARQAGHRSYAKLLEAGVRIFEYDKTMMHAKVLLVDGGWANVGSGNFDSRSLDLDLEINVAVLDSDLVEELNNHFLEDLEVSKEIDLETWNRRPRRKRAAELATEVIRQSL